jgi:hypothetical protein
MHNIPISKTIISNYIVNTRERERFPTKPPNTQHGLPTAQSVLNLRTNKRRKYKQENYKQSLQRKADRKAKSPPFNNND